MGEWRPINIAQENNTARLVWCPAYRNIYIVTWVTPLDDRAQPDHANGFWAHFGGGTRPLTELPTHWMPLPDPPTEGGDQ